MQSEPNTQQTAAPTGAIDFEAAVEDFYQGLYQFGLSLTGSPAEAADLTQETYRVLLLKADQVHDLRKLKSWLYTTLYRRFLGQRRHRVRFPQVELDEAAAELPNISPRNAEQIDAAQVVATLQTLPERFRAPVAMFYLEGLSYKEIATALSVPIGTVMSRLSRGKTQLRERLEANVATAPAKPTAPRSRRRPARRRTNTPVTAVFSPVALPVAA